MSSLATALCFLPGSSSVAVIDALHKVVGLEWELPVALQRLQLARHILL